MPSLSMLSALHGVSTAAPTLTPYVYQASLALISALFMLQPLNSTTIGKAFGSTMTLFELGRIYRHPGLREFQSKAHNKVKSARQRSSIIAVFCK